MYADRVCVCSRYTARGKTRNGLLFFLFQIFSEKLYRVRALGFDRL